MKSFLLTACLLGVLIGPNVSQLRAADPGDQFLEAYFQIQDGEAAERQGNLEVAQSKYNGALATLNAIKSQQPNWYPTLLEFRRKYCDDRLKALKAKSPAAPAAVATPATPPAEPAPPVVETPAATAEQIRQLQEDLQRTKEQYRELQQNRDMLAAQLESKLKEPAPTDRAAAEQTLEQLRELRASLDTAKTQLEAATAKAARVDALSTDLSRAQEKIQTLEANRTELNAKLQAALTAAAVAPSGPSVGELQRKNADLTAQLASTQAEISKIRNQLTAAPAAATAETVALRANLDQVKSQLQLRTAELSAARRQLDALQSENTSLRRSQEEIMSRLTESERQLRASKASTGKGDEIIEQLRKENALLRQIADRRFQPAQRRGVPAQPARKSGGFLWFKPRPKPPVIITNVPPVVSQSEVGRFTATVQAPELTAVTPAQAAPMPVAPAVPSTPPSIDQLLNDGETALAAKDYGSAASKYQEALARDSRNGAAMSGLGTALYHQGKNDEAAEVLRQAINVSPNDSHTRSLLGVVYIRQGKSDDAYSELTRAVALDPRNAEAHNYLGIVMSEKGWGAAGEQEIQRAVELNPQYADAHFNLAVLYARAKNPRLDLARSHYQKAIDLGAAPDAQLETLLKSAPGN